jgi:hypothetical protein
MTTGPSTHTAAVVPTASSRSALGVRLMIAAALALVGYGVLFLIRNFTGFIELGLTPEHVGGTRESIQAFSHDLYQYISHLQVAVSGFIIGLGLAVMSLAWNGARRGERWATWTALLVPVVALALAIPLHYVYGLAAIGHLGPIYLAALILLAGAGLVLASPRR